jgi:hypothetical protein
MAARSFSDQLLVVEQCFVVLPNNKIFCILHIDCEVFVVYIILLNRGLSFFYHTNTTKKMDCSCKDVTHLSEEHKATGDGSATITETPKPLPDLPLAKTKVERLQVQKSNECDGDVEEDGDDEDDEEKGGDEEDMEEEEEDQEEPLQPLIVINGKSMAFVLAFCLLLAFSCIMVGFSASTMLTDQPSSFSPPVIPQGIKALFPGMDLDEIINKAAANITHVKKHPGAPPFQYDHEWNIGNFRILAYHLWKRDTNYFNDCITFRFVNNPLSRMTSAIMLEKINEGEKHQLWGKTKCKREINDEGVVYCEEFSLCV